MVDTRMSAAALATLERRACHRLAHDHEVMQVEGDVPSRIVLTMTLDPNACGTSPEARELAERRAEVDLAARDADVGAHHVLQCVVHRVGVSPPERSKGASVSAAIASASLASIRGSPGCAFAYAAAPSPARRPNTSRSLSELPPRRFAPWSPPATSPAAKRPGMVAASVSASTRTPPIM